MIGLAGSFLTLTQVLFRSTVHVREDCQTAANDVLCTDICGPSKYHTAIGIQAYKRYW